MTIYERVLRHLRTATRPVRPDELVAAVYEGHPRPGNPISTIRAAISKGNSGLRGRRVGYHVDGYVLLSRLPHFLRADRLPTIEVAETDDAGRPLLVRLRVLSVLRQAPRPMTGDEIAEILYRHHPDGEPLYAREDVSQAVLDLRRSGTSIVSAGGRRRGYLLEGRAA